MSGRAPTRDGAGREVALRRKVLLVDPERCDGCAKCVEACSEFHTASVDPDRSRIRVLALAAAASPERSEREGERAELFVPSTCQQCETPTCAEACPTAACHRAQETHTVVIDRDVCMGCKTCIVACPFGAPSFDAVDGVSIKCDLCGGDPRCVRACGPGALEFVFADENNARRRRRHGVKAFGWR